MYSCHEFPIDEVIPEHMHQEQISEILSGPGSTYSRSGKGSAYSSGKGGSHTSSRSSGKSVSKGSVKSFRSTTSVSTDTPRPTTWVGECRFPPEFHPANPDQLPEVPNEQVPIILRQGKPNITPRTGRLAMAYPTEHVHKLYQAFKEGKHGQTIMFDNKEGNGPIVLGEDKLGPLLLFIGKDPDGYELCFVTIETMLPSAVAAVELYHKEDRQIDWHFRDQQNARAVRRWERKWQNWHNYWANQREIYNRSYN